jgi:SagB-type dehydrogenase family enzyme
MRKFHFLAVVVLILAASPAITREFNQQVEPKAADRIDLPAPSRTGGMTLTEALVTRRSVRSFAETKLTQQELSQLLWAAQGITDDKGHRTAPSARAQYFLHLYVATADGFFEYIPAGHKLLRLSVKDLRAELSSQPAVAAAPEVFVIAGNYDSATQGGRETGLRWVHLEAGHAAQNLLLQATALRLAAVPVGGIQPEHVAQAASLPPSSTPIYLIPVGHPK